jgi:hypothetical protein
MAQRGQGTNEICLSARSAGPDVALRRQEPAQLLDQSKQRKTNTGRTEACARRHFRKRKVYTRLESFKTVSIAAPLSKR